MTEQLTIGIGEAELLPCPFCGGTEFHMTDWWDDDGEYDAVECACCKAAAPADVWNRRVDADI